MKKIALIPARAGSKRIPSKNIAPLAGHPVLAYSIQSAIQSKLFDKVYVSTDSVEIAEIAIRYGASVDFLRPAEFAQDTSTDFDWLGFTLKEFEKVGDKYEVFFLLRPTSPLRTSNTLLRAWDVFLSVPDAHSLRAVQKVSEHPGKMWKMKPPLMVPLWPNPEEGQPFHSRPYQSLPETYIQNASLEISRPAVVSQYKNISGEKVVPFITEGYEGYDLNSREDLEYLNFLIEKGYVKLRTL